MNASELFTLAPEHPIAKWFPLDTPPWEWLSRIKVVLSEIKEQLPASPIPQGLHIEGPVFFEGPVKLAPFGSITGPAWFGKECEFRPGVYVRGNVIAGRGCLLGNSCEYKNCILLDEVQPPHYNYVRDSVLGNHAHLGAGAILSNLRFDQKPVVVRAPEGNYESGLRKLGAMVGDWAEAGCNVVLQPGTVLGRHSAVAPGLAYGGYLAPSNLAYWKPGLQTMHRSILER